MTLRILVDSKRVFLYTIRMSIMSTETTSHVWIRADLPPEYLPSVKRDFAGVNFLDGETGDSQLNRITLFLRMNLSRIPW